MRGALSKVAIAPPVPALLPEHAGLTDPVAPLRAVLAEAVGWLVADCRTVGALTTDEPARRIADHLLAPHADHLAVVHRTCTPGGEHGSRRHSFETVAPPPTQGAHVDALLVMANGSARRGEKAPGHFDDRARGFDAGLEEALMLADSEALESVDVRLGAELLAAGLPALQALGAMDLPVGEVQLDYADDPFGVQYWVVRWQCDS